MKTAPKSQQPTRSVEEVKEISLTLSQQILEVTSQAGSGHASSSLSAIDILTCLYFKPVMHYDPSRPQWPDRDRFILSKGHGAPALYAALAHAGFFDASQLPTLRQFGSPLEGHPNMRRLPGIEASTGSLGQGLSIGIGHALAGLLDNKDYHVYVMIGDGELQEGQVWEAAMFASSHKLKNLTLVVDHNKYQQTGAVERIMPSLYPMADKWRAFGWYVEDIDGHDMEQIVEAFQKAVQVGNKPQVIIAHTSKGKQLSLFTEDDKSHKHGKPLKPDQVKAATAELQEKFK